MARPFTRLTWDNAALVAPSYGEAAWPLHPRRDRNRRERPKLKAPVFVLPGQAENCVTLPLGWGRTAGGLGAGVGFDAYQLRTASDPWTADIASITRTGETHIGSRPRKATTGSKDARSHPGGDARPIQHAIPTRSSRRPRTSRFTRRSHIPTAPGRWPIDLNSCIGCQACTIACQAENNVPVVGKDQVLDQRVMHWLRIDRYYSGTGRQSGHRLRADALHALRGRALRGGVSGARHGARPRRA